MTPADQVREKILSLQGMLLEAHPLMPNLLQTIRKQLKEDPEVVTLLSEEEIHVVVAGLMKQTNTEIAATVAKKVTAKKIASMDLSDLGL